MKVGIEGGEPWVAEYYEATVVSAVDYYPFGSAMAGRKYNQGTYRYGFNGKEEDSEWGSQMIQDYGFRIYNPTIGKFLSMDPLTNSYPWYTPYQFAGNKVIQAIDLDGLEEYTLVIYSPIISNKLLKAINDGDILEQRRLTYWALNNTFSDTWVDRKNKDLKNIADSGNPAAQLTKHLYDDSFKYEGVTILLYSYVTKDGIRTDNPEEANSIVKSDIIHFSPVINDNGEYGLKPADANSPVDINLWTGNGKVADGSIYYKDFDFTGNYGEANGFFSGSGIMGGRIRGYGYLEFSYEMNGLGVQSNTLYGVTTGTYVGPGSEEGFPSGATPYNFAGQGSVTSVGGVSEWEGYGNNQIMWKGEAAGMGLPSLSDIIDIGKFRTNTQIMEPSNEYGNTHNNLLEDEK